MGIKGRMQWYIRAQLLFVLPWMKQRLAKKKIEVGKCFYRRIFFF